MIGAETSPQRAEGSATLTLASGPRTALDPDPVKSVIAPYYRPELAEAEYSFTSASALKLDSAEAVT